MNSDRPPVGRLEMLAWVNASMDTDYHKIEQLADGVIYCQILDAVFPTQVSLWKVNFNAQFEEEFEHNLLIAKDVLKKCNLRKVLLVDKIKKARFADNQDVIQWCYQLVQQSKVDISEYPAYSLRMAAISRQHKAAVAKATAAGKSSPFLFQLKAELHPNRSAVKILQEKNRAAQSKLAVPFAHNTNNIMLRDNNDNHNTENLQKRHAQQQIHPHSHQNHNHIDGVDQHQTQRQQQPEKVFLQNHQQQQDANHFAAKSEKQISSTKDSIARNNQPSSSSVASTGAMHPDEANTVQNIILMIENLLVQRLNKQSERNKQIKEMKRETDHYFTHLLGIEQLCLAHSETCEDDDKKQFTEQILQILHSPDPMFL